MNHYVPQFELEEDYANAAVPSCGLSRQQMNKQPDEIMELLWENGQVVVHSQNQQRLPRKSPPPNASTQQLPSMAPPSLGHGDTTPPTNLLIQEDEMASWLHFDDSSLDRDVYSDLLYHHQQHPPASTPVSSAAAPARPIEVRPSPAVAPPQPRSHQPDQTPRPPTLPPPHPNPHPPLAAAATATATASGGGSNFPLFSSMRAPNRFQQDPGPSAPSKHPSHTHTTTTTPNRPRESRETTVVDSSDTPMVAGISNRFPHHHMTPSAVDVSGSGWSFGITTTCGGGIGDTTTGCPSVSRDGETCELTLTSSPGGSGASASATATTDHRGNHHHHHHHLQPADDRKRKARQVGDADANGDCHSEDIEIESAELRKQCRGSSATKRSRAAEVHNLSERRRRDRINEKMRALQELIPRCSKTDKASMLDEAIEYLKSLQMQVQMMSMGCGMIPMMFPQQYMPSPMGMGMGMGMNRPMMPFPALLAGSGLQQPGAAAAAASHMGQRFQLPAFQMPPNAADMARMQQQQVVGQGDHMTVNPLGHQQPILPPGMANMGHDPYQQYMGMQQQQQQQMQAQIPQTQNQPSPPEPSNNNRPSKNRGGDG